MKMIVLPAPVDGPRQFYLLQMKGKELSVKMKGYVLSPPDECACCSLSCGPG
jgi:hypothetical protein